MSISISPSDYRVTVSEDAPVGTTVGTLSCEQDPYYPTAITLSIVEDVPFSIRSNGSDGTIYTNAKLDYESVSQYIFTVVGVDLNNNTATATVTVNVSNVNEGLTFIGPFEFTKESVSSGGVVGEVAFRDEDDYGSYVTMITNRTVPFNVSVTYPTSSNNGKVTITATQPLSYTDQFTTYTFELYLVSPYAPEGSAITHNITVKLEQAAIIEPSNIGLIFNKFATWGGKALQFAKSAPTPPGPSFDEVTIGTQTWMAKNLSMDDGGEGIIILDDVSANGVNFGTQGYYTWDAAVRLANSIPGWHLPSYDEWNTLFSYIGGTNVSGTKLQSTEGWDWANVGTDDYGFTVYPVGYINSDFSTEPDYAGRRVLYWASNEYEGDNRYVFYFAGDRTVYGQYNPKYYWYSVRLIKDT